MSYNIMNKRASFQGSNSGSIEDMVDIHTNQTITGRKTITDLTASTLLVSNDLTASGIVSASAFYGDGTGLSGVTVDPDGVNTQVQFNADGAFGASSNFVFNTGSSTLTVTGDITASANISASAFFGDGTGLTNVSTTVNAADLVGTLSASQIDHSSPLTNSAGNLTLKFAASNSGLTDSSGIKLDFGGLGTTSYVNTYNIATEDTSGNHFKITLATIGNNIETSATNITAGTLNNARLPGIIDKGILSASVGLSASTAQFGEITSNLIPETTNTYYLGSPDLSKRWVSVNSVASNVSGLAVSATGAIQHALGIGTLNPSYELDVTGTIAVNGQISASSYVSASSFHGDGSGLTNLPPPQYRYAYYNGFGNLGVLSNFINFTALGVGTSLNTLRGGILIAPSSGSVVSVRVTPTDNANIAAQDESIIVAITKNGVNTLANCEANGALLLAATGSFSDPISFYDDAGSTTNTYSANLDLKNNSPVITGSLDFDPGDILGLNLRTPDGAVNECGITLVLKFQED